MEDDSLNEYADFLEGHLNLALTDDHSLNEYAEFLEGHLDAPVQDDHSLDEYAEFLEGHLDSPIEGLLLPSNDQGTEDTQFHLNPQDSLAVNGAGNIAPSSSGTSRTWPVVAPGKSIGVTKPKLLTTETWEAHIWRSDVDIHRRNKRKNGSQHFLGSYITEDAAKWVHDLAAITLNSRVSKYGLLYSLNYPYEYYVNFLAEHPGITCEEMLELMKRSFGKFARGACQMKGVRLMKTGLRPGFTAVISRTRGLVKKLSMTVGHFATEEEAGREYDRALLFLEGKDDLGCVSPNFPAASYSQAEVDETGRKLCERYPEIKNLKRKR